MITDPLLEIFYKHLKKTNSLPAKAEDFVHNVVADYMFLLMNQGHIPEYLYDPLEIDLKEEVLELYQKLLAGPINKVKQTINMPPAKSRRLN